MANADGPRFPGGVSSRQIQISAGVDRVMFERLQFARRQIDRESLRDGAKIQHQRTPQGDGLRVRIELHVAVTDSAL